MSKQGDMTLSSLKTLAKGRIGLFDITWVFLLGALVRLCLIITNPGIYGGDSVFRIMNSDKVFVAYNLPLLQFLIYLTVKISTLPFAIRALMILIGSVGGCGIYLLASRLFDRTVARLAAILFITNPFILVYSIVPYQEILMISLIFLAAYYFIREEKSYDLYLSSLFIGMACLTRYEAWLAGLVMAAVYILRRFDKNDWRSNLKTAVLAGSIFCWAPIIWMALNGGINPEGTFVLERGFSLGRLIRIPYVITKTIYHSTPATALLGLLGITILLMLTEKRKDKKLLTIAGFLLLFITALTISGHDYPPGTNLVTEREIHIPMSIFLICAAYGISEVFKWVKTKGTEAKGQGSPFLPLHLFASISLMLIFIVSFPLKMAYDEVSSRSSDPGIRGSYLAAQFIDKTLKEDEKALVLAKEWPRALIEGAFQRGFGKYGPEAIKNAQKIADRIGFPHDYQRLVITSTYGKDELVSPYAFRHLNKAETDRLLKKEGFRYLVFFSDFTPEYPCEEFILELLEGKKELLKRFGDDVKHTSIYRIAHLRN